MFTPKDAGFPDPFSTSDIGIAKSDQRTMLASVGGPNTIRTVVEEINGETVTLRTRAGFPHFYVEEEEAKPVAEEPAPVAFSRVICRPLDTGVYGGPNGFGAPFSLDGNGHSTAATANGAHQYTIFHPADYPTGSGNPEVKRWPEQQTGFSLTTDPLYGKQFHISTHGACVSWAYRGTSIYHRGKRIIGPTAYTIYAAALCGDDLLILAETSGHAVLFACPVTFTDGTKQIISTTGTPVATQWSGAMPAHASTDLSGAFSASGRRFYVRDIYDATLRIYDVFDIAGAYRYDVFVGAALPLGFYTKNTYPDPSSNPYTTSSTGTPASGTVTSTQSGAATGQRSSSYSVQWVGNALKILYLLEEGAYSYYRQRIQNFVPNGLGGYNLVGDALTMLATVESTQTVRWIDLETGVEEPLYTTGTALTTTGYLESLGGPVRTHTVGADSFLYVAFASNGNVLIHRVEIPINWSDTPSGGGAPTQRTDSDILCYGPNQSILVKSYTYAAANNGYSNTVQLSASPGINVSPPEQQVFVGHNILLKGGVRLVDTGRLVCVSRDECLIVHGEGQETVPAENAFNYAKYFANGQLYDVPTLIGATAADTAYVSNSYDVIDGWEPGAI